MNTNRLLNEEQAAQYLGVQMATLRKQRSYGPVPGGLPAVPFVKLGRIVRYDIEDLNRLVQAQKMEIA